MVIVRKDGEKREILFKAQRSHNGEWVKGLPSYDVNGNLEEMEVYKGFCNCDAYEIDPATLCQYTGYSDQRKEKAFEHDIVFYEASADRHYYGHIVFKDGRFLIAREEDALRSDIHFWFTERSVYIVGNIFDDSEIAKRWKKEVKRYEV